MMQSFMRYVFIFFVVLCGASCSRLDQENPVPLPPTIALANKTPEQVFALLNGSYEHFQTVRASGQLEIKDRLADTAQKCSCLILLRKDGSLLIKGYQPLIPNYFTLIVKDGDFTYYVPRKDIAYQGAINALDSNKNYTLSLDPKLLLLALLPPYFAPGKNKIDFLQGSSFVVAKLIDEGTITTISTKYHFNGNSLLQSALQVLDSNGVESATITFFQPMVSGKVAYPKKIVIINKKQQTEIQLSLNKLLINSELPDSLFTIDTPEGVIVEEIKK